MLTISKALSASQAEIYHREEFAVVGQFDFHRSMKESDNKRNRT